MEIQKSRYLPFFLSNAERFKEQFKLIGSVILVEKIKYPELKTASGLYIPNASKDQLKTLTSDLPDFYRVLLVGEGYYDDETGADAPLDVKPGEVVQLAAQSVRLYSQIPGVESYEAWQIGYAREEDITWHFKGEDAFHGFFRDFNQAIKGEVAAGS